MTLDTLLLELRARRLILIDESTVWPSSRLTCSIRRAVRRHRRGLAMLIRWNSLWTCPTRLHQEHYYYRRGEWICAACEWLWPEVEKWKRKKEVKPV